MNIIILSEKDKISKNQFEFSDERFTHVTDILKSEIDDVLEIGLLNGPIGKAKIISIGKSEITLEVFGFNKLDKSNTNIDLICALPRPQTLKKVLAISATMGVRKIFFIKSEKVEKSYFHSPLLLEENYNKFLIDGLTQGKHTQIPIVSFHKQFKKFFEDEFLINNYTTKLLAHPNSDKNLLNFKFKDKQNIVVAIGPEGGWNDFEINYMTNLGFDNFLLSKNILRVESAVTAALSQIELLSLQF
ncbi:MAG: RsmE family RNA methyltransferase [Melioribacteraceae bacterium]